jgi:hypothetical protein
MLKGIGGVSFKVVFNTKVMKKKHRNNVAEVILSLLRVSLCSFCLRV